MPPPDFEKIDKRQFGPDMSPVLRLKMRKWRNYKEAPTGLRIALGVDSTLWNKWTTEMEAVMTVDPWFRRVDLAWAFFCCPLGPYQMCLCMANPWLHHNDARTINAIQKVERMINADLAALKSDGYFRMTFGPPDPDKSGYFFKRSDAATGTLFKLSLIHI